MGETHFKSNRVVSIYCTRLTALNENVFFSPEHLKNKKTAVINKTLKLVDQVVHGQQIYVRQLCNLYNELCPLIHSNKYYYTSK